MPDFEFQQVDVFTATPLKGNPLAVVIGADALSDAEMMAFASWTNLSETTFLLKPTRPEADYRVRIFTPSTELPFAGHPTLGSCHVWLDAGGKPKGAEIIQECSAGLVRIRHDGNRLAFAAPPAAQNEVPPAELAQIARALGISSSAILASRSLSQTAPAWVAVMLASREEVLSLKPDYDAMAGLEVGVVAPSPGTDVQFEVRAFVPGPGPGEDPVTGSLNAGLARWLIGASMAPPHYVAAQGTCLGRAGRVHVSQTGADIWIGGETVSCIKGVLTL
jgi:PhzF family phenazine biosynthesis protein